MFGRRVFYFITLTAGIVGFLTVVLPTRAPSLPDSPGDGREKKPGRRKTRETAGRSAGPGEISLLSLAICFGCGSAAQCIAVVEREGVRLHRLRAYGVYVVF